MDFEKYTTKSQQVVQKAINIASANGQTIVDTAHLLQAVFEEEPHIVSFINQKLGVQSDHLTGALKAIISNQPKSSGSDPSFSNKTVIALNKAQDYLKGFGDEYVAVEHLLLGVLNGSDATANLLKDAGYKKKPLIEAIKELRQGEKVTDQNSDSNYRSLEKYSINLNQKAKDGKIDPVIGRDEEIRRVLQILSRRTKNNPVLIGEPGVGKTAIVEGLAQRIIQGDVPENLKSKTIFALDMGLLVAGAKYKGEFEERLKSVIKEVQNSAGEIVLFIDEIHTLIGAGGGEGAMDAANLLKPALARGELLAIGATTLDEYQKHVEKDKALERRFQTIVVDEPTEEDTISILRGIKDKYELHHGIRIQDDAVIASVKLATRYIADRFLPDKAIDLMDEAASKIRLEIDSMPEELDELERRVLQLEIEREAIRREKDKDKEAILSKELAQLVEERDQIKAQWKNEKDQIEGVTSLKEALEKLRHEADTAERAGDYGKVAELRYGKIAETEAKLAQEQQALADSSASRLVKEEITADDIAEVVAKWTGVPVNKMLQSEMEKLLSLEEELGKRVAGQEVAITALSDAVRRSRAGLQDPKRPIGSFIFFGTTGVGKTELAKALAEYMFDDENAMVRIDMSEYQERHSVSRLIGAPPGYVGYDEGGQLTEAVRRRPYSVVLLDEIEKAHPDAFNILLQVLDDGQLTDNKGRLANFKNTIIIMTSNVGSHIIQERFAEATEANIDDIAESTRSEVFDLMRQTIRPEFLNRIDEIIMFQPLRRDEIRKITGILFGQIQERLAANGVEILATNEALDYLGEKGFDPAFGARPLKRVIQREVLNQLSKEIIAGKVTKDSVVSVGVENDQITFDNVQAVPEI